MSETVGRRLLALASLSLVSLLAPARGAASSLSEYGIAVNADLSSEVSFRTSREAGFSRPSIARGNLVQNRYQLRLEWFHDLNDFLEDNPFEKLDYLIELKPAYEGVTDYGPDALSDSDDAAVEVLAHQRFRHDAFPWRAFASIKYGRTSLKLGRQILDPWGRAIGLRVLSMVHPVDSRIGSLFVEPQADKLIPLWMANATFTLSGYGVELPIVLESLDAYVVPGPIDNQSTPVPSFASPFAPDGIPRPEDLGAEAELHRLDKDWSSTRGGARLMMRSRHLPWGRINFGLLYYRTFNDIPSTRFRIEPLLPDLSPPCNLSGNALQIAACLQRAVAEIHPYPVDVLGAQVDSPYPKGLVYLDAAIFLGERVSAAADQSAAALLELAVRADTTGTPQRTSFHERDVFRSVIGIDYYAAGADLPWFLEQAIVNLQYAHSHVLGNVDGLSGSVDPGASDLQAFIPSIASEELQRDDGQVTFGVIANVAWRDLLQLSLIGAYDIHRVTAIVPGIAIDAGVAGIFIKYASVFGDWHSFGALQDDDVLWIRISASLEVLKMLEDPMKALFQKPLQADRKTLEDTAPLYGL